MEQWSEDRLNSLIAARILGRLHIAGEVKVIGITGVQGSTPTLRRRSRRQLVRWGHQPHRAAGVTALVRYGLGGGHRGFP